jgi:predicted TIM-barrel fold metal-dependent hydrolase
VKKKINWMVLLAIITGSCSNNDQYYKVDNYLKVDKMDVHAHLFTDKNSLVERAQKNNFRLLTIMVDHGSSDEFKKEADFAVYQTKRNPDVVKFATSFEMAGWDNPDWVEKTIAYLNSSFENGAVAVKVWKNIGMEFRDKEGKLVMIDDPKFDPIFKMLTEKKIPLIGHLGEPKNCWLPLDQMTTKDDRNYFKNNPQYHMYLHPELPSYEDQIAARDRMLEKNPDLIFIGAHLGSLEWNIDELAKRLDKFPNMAVDLAARLGHIHFQSAKDREKVRNFFIKYQDRILYGTDQADYGKTDEKEDSQQSFYDTWKADWTYFVTDEKLKDQNIDEEFTGIKLPREVVDKIFMNNARKYFSVYK